MPSNTRSLPAEDENSLAYAHKLERQLQESEERYWQVLHTAPSGFWRADTHGRILEVNPAYCQMSGYSAEELLRMSISDIEAIESPEDVRRHIEKIIRQGQDHFESRHRCKDGRIIDVEVSTTYSPLESGQFFGFLRDITERKRAEAERERLLAAERAQRELAQTLIEITNALNSHLDSAAVLQTILEQLARVVSYNSASVMLIQGDLIKLVAQCGFRSQSQHFASAPVQSFPIIQKMLTSRRPLIIADVANDPHWHRRPGGDYIHSWLGAPMVTEGQVIGVLNVDNEQPDFYTAVEVEVVLAFANQAAIAIRNARMIEQARQDASARAELLREVNHRVGNNLATLIGIIDMERGHAAREQTDYRSIVQDMENRIRGLAKLHQLLQDSGWAPLRLDQLAGRLIRLVLDMLSVRQRVVIDVPPSEVRVNSRQAHKLALIINELATNTVKHALSGKSSAHITARVTRDEGEAGLVTLEYRDDGPGYPPDVLRGERSNVGLDLIRALTQTDLDGTLTLSNDGGAVTAIRF